VTIHRFELDGEEYVLDNEKLMFSEAMLIQQHAGLNTQEYTKLAGQGHTLAVGVTVWIAMLRQRAQRKGIGVRQAADEWPFAEFDFDINAIQMRGETENPTAGPTDGPETPTSPGTSGQRPAATRPRARARATSASSRTSSASVPGSGTS
jgi:hypothetical protein